MSRVRTISLGQRLRSQSVLTVCAFQNRVRPITWSCMVGFENYFTEMIKRRRSVVCKNHVARSKVKVTAGTLSLCIPESCPTHNFIWKLVGFENNLAEMIITKGRNVACKNHVAWTKVKDTVHNYSLCIGILCSDYNLTRHGGIWKLFGTNDHQDKTMCPVQEACL